MLQFVLPSNVDQHVDGPREGEQRTSPRQTNQSSTGQCVDHASRSFKQNELFFTGTLTIYKKVFSSSATYLSHQIVSSSCYYSYKFEK